MSLPSGLPTSIAEVSAIVREACRSLVESNSRPFDPGRSESLFGSVAVMGTVTTGADAHIEVFSDYMIHPALLGHARALASALRETADRIEARVALAEAQAAPKAGAPS